MRKKYWTLSLSVGLFFCCNLDVTQQIYAATGGSSQNGVDWLTVPVFSLFSGLHIFHVKQYCSCCFSSLRPEKMVWHGSTSGGQRHLDSYCESWRVSHRAVTGMATSLQSGALNQQTSSSCSSSYVVLCIENSYIGHAKR